ncbi:MAG: hypothetical protein AAF682_10015 [Planctomycetota bacterium]
MKTRLLGALALLVPSCTSPTAPIELDALAQDLAAGRVAAAEVLVAPEWQVLRREESFRLLMRDHAPVGDVRLDPPEEPGVPLRIEGRITDTAGAPLAGVGLYVYHTDRDGLYAPGESPDDGERSPRLYGFLRTDAGGRYRVRSVLPGGYAGHDDAIPHVHFALHAPGYERTRGSGPPSLYFGDRVTMKPEYRAEIDLDGGWIASPEPDADGVVRCTYDWVLRRGAETR